MNKFVSCILTAGIAVSFPASAQAASSVKTSPVDAASLDLARQVLDAQFPPEKRAQTFSKMMDSIVAQSRLALEKYGKPGDKEFQSIVDDSSAQMGKALKAAIIAGLPDIYESRARAYARNLSTDELRAILSFSKSPAGAHFFQALPSMSTDPDVIAANERTIARLLEDAKEIAQQQQKAAKDYVSAKGKSEKTAFHKPSA